MFKQIEIDGQWVIYLVHTQNFPKTNISLPPDTHAYVRFQFSENFAYVLNEWLLKKFSETYSFLEILERFLF